MFLVVPRHKIPQKLNKNTYEKLKVQFDFILLYDRSCENDALFLYDGVEDPEKLMTETIHGLCGESLSLPNYFTTTAGDLTIKFRTDYANEAGGFTMFVTPFSKNGKRFFTLFYFRLRMMKVFINKFSFL